MFTTKAWPLFSPSELEGGHIVAVEVGPRSELMDKSRNLNAQLDKSRSEAEAEAEADQDADVDEAQQHNPITIGAQIGDRRAEEAIMPHCMDLRACLKELCRESYSPDVHEFAIVLRVDGDIWYWEKEGCDRMRRSKKERYITIDIYVPRNRWEGVSGIEVRKYLVACVEDALRKMIGKLQRDKVPIDGDALLGDIAAVRENYLSTDEDQRPDEG